MSLPLIVLLPLLGSLVPLLSNNRQRTLNAWSTALLPAIALGIVIAHAPGVISGEVYHFSMSWVPQLGLDLAFRIDGLSLLFLLLILGIGLLIILYSRYYLSPDDSMPLARPMSKSCPPARR